LIKRIIISLILLLSILSIFACSSGKKVSNDKITFINEFTPDLRFRLAQSYFISAKSNQITNNFLDAIQDYKFSADYFPSAQTYHNIGECYLQIAEFDYAINNFEKAIAIDSTFVLSYHILIDLYDNKNDKLKAIELTNSLLKYENTEEQKLRLAYLYSNIDIAKSIEIIKNCIDEYNNYELYLYLMDIYLFLKDEQNYLAYEEKYLTSPEISNHIINKLTEENIKNNNLVNSIKYIDTLQKYASANVFNGLLASIYPYSLFKHTFHLNVAHKLINSINTSGLEQDLKNVFLGNLYLNINDSLTAREYYNNSAGKQKNYLLFSVITNINYQYYDYAMQLINNNRDSLTFYSPEQYTILTSLLANYKEYDFLINLYKREYYRDSTRKYLLIALGDTYSLIKNIDSAIKYYDLAVEYFPENPNLLNNYSYFLSISGKDLNKALKYADISIKLQPDNPNIIDTYGWIQFLIGNKEEAYKYVSSALKLLPNEEEGYIHLSYILLAKGDIVGAVLNWLKAYNIKKKIDLTDKVYQ